MHNSHKIIDLFYKYNRISFSCVTEVYALFRRNVWVYVNIDIVFMVTQMQVQRIGSYPLSALASLLAQCKTWHKGWLKRWRQVWTGIRAHSHSTYMSNTKQNIFSYASLFRQRLSVRLCIAMHWNLPYTDHSQLVAMRIKNVSDSKWIVALRSCCALNH